MDDLPILIVEDDETVGRLLAGILQREGYQTTTVHSAEAALRFFPSGKFDLVLTDIGLPGMNGLLLAQKIKKERPETEIIFMTGEANFQTVVDAFRSGACDYLTKPYRNIMAVSEAVRRAAEKIRLHRENARETAELRQAKEDLERLNRRLMELAIRDGLTELYNYRYFRELLQIEITRALRHGHPFSLIFMDVDHFKLYNDTHGHIDGDKVLCRMADLLRRRFRKTDMIARYGGEEFIVLMPETSTDLALRLAEQARSLIETEVFEGEKTQPSGKLTVSAGVASFPNDAVDDESLLRRADAALYRAKADGRNCVRKA